MKTISVIIVNYNVKDFLEQALLSLQRALNNIDSEVIVVDNASVDGSVPMVRQRFPRVKLIESSENVGFSAGNNLGLKEATGKYIVLLNPDTVVQEDTFIKLLAFFEQEPTASAATCKILNPDGTFSVDCRHSIPTPLTAFWKLLGLDKLFPKSRIFARYNLTFLDENELNQVEAISGSFMMIKKEVVDRVGELDEDFFMYCEDIDYCHRINQSGGKIFYVPDSQIIHYKGESTKKNNLDYVITFNRSLYLFYKKHYQQKYIAPFKWIILLGVIFRGTIIFTRNLINRYFPLLLDLVILNLIMLVSFYIRFELKHGFRWENFVSSFSIVHLFTSAFYFFSAFFFGVVERVRFSVRKTIFTVGMTFLMAAALTFFLKQFAFSRLVVLISAISAMVVLPGWRILLRFVGRKSSPGLSFFSKRTLIVGTDADSLALVDKLNSWIDSGMRVVGMVSLDGTDVGQKLSGTEVVTSMAHLKDYLKLRKVDLVIFPTHHITYETILGTMASVHQLNIEFKIVPNHLEYMISKSSVERFQEISLVDIDYNYGRPFNRLSKRWFDFFTAGILFLFTCIPGSLVWLGRLKQIQHITGPGGERLLWTAKSGFLRFFLHLIDIIAGRLSFVGAPVSRPQAAETNLHYKPGLTGVAQQGMAQNLSWDIIRKHEYQYLKNHSFFLDMEILLNALFRGHHS